jgi:exo-1,4-beta-D-glucosaminidase
MRRGGATYTARHFYVENAYSRCRRYRATFIIDPESSATRLEFQGINYRAAVWVNGQFVASLVGTFRTFDVDISSTAAAGLNAVAVQITRPFDRALPSTNHDTDLAISFVDWSPAPPDGNMGLWRPVLLHQNASLSLSTPYVTVSPRSSSPPKPAAPCDISVTIIVHATNTAPSTALVAELSCALALADGRRVIVAQQISVPPLQTIRCTFVAIDFPQLLVSDAELWWPWQMGSATLNSLTCNLLSQQGNASHTSAASVGLRWVGSSLDHNAHRLYTVNGHPILVRLDGYATAVHRFCLYLTHARGAGWSPDLFLRQACLVPRASFTPNPRSIA